MNDRLFKKKVFRIYFRFLDAKSFFVDIPLGVIWLLLNLIKRYIKNKNLKVSRLISKNDNMFTGETNHYFLVGESAIHCIEAALTISQKKEVKSVLDLPCGYGRVLRFLVAKFPEAKITACDLDKNGVNFCVETFGVNGVYSSPEVSEIQIDTKFDLIWCGSLLTHLDKEVTIRFMDFFIDSLEEDGILVVTFHGRYSIAKQKSKLKYISDEQFKIIHSDFERLGYGYANYKEKTGYGISVSKPSWVISYLENKDNIRLLSYTERHWDDHQDVLVLIKKNIYEYRTRDGETGSFENKTKIEAVFESVIKQHSGLAYYFKDYKSHNFWIWANTNGLFLDAEIRSVLPPFPPTDSMSCGSNDRSDQEFALSGAGYYDHMEKALNSIGRSWGDMDTVLEFGCGIGRVARLFAKHAPRQKFIGFDLNDKAIEWLRNNLGFGEFHAGSVKPPLPIEEGSIDVVFSISVFSHLKEESQTEWLKEFYRILKPGGILFQTVHGRHALNLCKAYDAWRNAINVSSEDFEKLEKEIEETGFSWVPHSIETTGTDDYGVSFQTERFILKEWTRGFELLGVWVGRIDDWQDLVALRRSDVIRVKPEWPSSGYKPVESVTMVTIPDNPEIGKPLILQATAIGGEDVYYKFFVSEFEGSWRALSDWQKNNSYEYIPWVPRQYGFIVHSASGPGVHNKPEAETGFLIKVGG